jgi:hypothetical protein
MLLNGLNDHKSRVDARSMPPEVNLVPAGDWAVVRALIDG